MTAVAAIKKREIDAQAPEGNAISVIAAVTGYLRATRQGNKTATAAKDLMECEDYEALCEAAFYLTQGNVEVVNRP